jgi:DNA-directed RNA polymerase subunit omega
MIEALKSDTLVEKAGGRFKLCSLIQRRLTQLMDGARPLVERNGRSDLEVVIDEIMKDRITLEFAPEDTSLPASGEPSEDEQPLLN